MKLILASPSYGPIAPECVIGQRVAIMHAQKHAGVMWYGDCSPHDVKQSTIDVARNRIAQEACRSDADAVFWLDSDVVLPPDAVTKLVLAGKDMICGIYCQRVPPHYPVVCHFDPTGGADHRGTMNWIVTWPEDVIGEADGCGFGCVLTSVAMLRAMPRPWFHFGDFSEDFTFCRQAKAAGFQLYVHTGVLCGHMGIAPVITVDDFRRTFQAGRVEADHSAA